MDLSQFLQPKFTPPKDAQITKDIQYSSQPGHVRQRLDLYIPSGRGSSPLSLVIYIHGGAFMGGSKMSPLMPIRLLSANPPVAIASLDYRLSGDGPFPAALQDCKSAVRWLRAHADDFGLDSARFVAWGESAGAHMASMLGVTCASTEEDGGVEDFEVGDELGVSSAVAGVVAYYGPSDFLKMDEQALKDGKSLHHNPPDSPESRYIGATITEAPEKVARANPITYISAEAKPPPFFLAHGKNDHIVPYGQSLILEEALKKVGVPVTMHMVGNSDHIFLGASKEEMDALDKATDEFLASVLG
ncbi:unnamed protein product [Discula destructiva]